MEKAKNSEGCRKQIFQPPFQFSGLSGTLFCVETLCGPPIWRPVTNGKLLEFTLQWKWLHVFFAHEIKCVFEHISQKAQTA